MSKVIGIISSNVKIAGSVVLSYSKFTTIYSRKELIALCVIYVSSIVAGIKAFMDMYLST